MSATITILTMHNQMTRLLPEAPDNWRFIEGGDKLDAAIEAHADEINVLLSASIEKIDAALMDRLPNLKMIASVAAGYDKIDVDTAHARNIAVTNSPGMNSADVADMAVTMMNALAMHLHKYHQFILDDKWRNGRQPLRHSIRNRTIGIVGMGSIGRAVADRLKPFGAKIHWWGPRPKPDIDYPMAPTVEALADKCDGLILCCRPDPSTHHLINADILKRLGPKGILVNVARGTVVDEDALIEALKTETIAGAGLDVFDPEPTSGEKWRDVPNTMLSPHMGGATFQALFAQGDLTYRNIDNHFSGKPLLTPVVPD